jgi:tetratricopeptide (TPR) repeat protein
VFPAAAQPGQNHGRPQEILSWRHQILPSERYQELAKEWESYVKSHPGDPSAWVEWADALRYSGEHEESRDKYIRAFEIDSTNIVALEAYASMKSTEIGPGEASELHLTHERLLRAARTHPDYARTYYSLWVTSLMQGDEEGAADCLRKMVALGDMPRALFDYGHNMIAGAPAGAIIFTNGDNDTYPPLAVQVLTGQRQDVSIVNLSLLNTRWYIRYLRDSGVAITLDDDAVDVLKAKRDDLIAAQMQRHIFETLDRADWPRPLFYAITIAPGRKVLPCERVLEGLLERIVPAEGEEIGTASDDLERTRELIDTVYRLDSMTDPLLDWDRESSLVSLGRNYVALLTRLGEGLIAESPDEAATYFYRAVSMLAFHGETQWIESILALWDERHPESGLLLKARALVE